jgi:hypothetical protein
MMDVVLGIGRRSGAHAGAASRCYYNQTASLAHSADYHGQTRMCWLFCGCSLVKAWTFGRYV